MYKQIGDLRAGQYFRATAHEDDNGWFRVRRQVEDHTEAQRILDGPDGDLGPVSLFRSYTMVAPLGGGGV